MAYIGSTPTSQSFIAGTDTFSGTGSQTAFTLSRAVNSVNDILVVVNNVEQQPANYSVSGLTLTFSAAPSAGTNNVYVRYLSTTLQSNSVGDLSVSTAKIQTGAITTDKIADGAVVTVDISNGAITAEKLNGAQSGSAPIYAARAWVNFNGTGTVAIRAAGNVSSVTDNGTGDYTVNFTTAMPDANYSLQMTLQRGDGAGVNPGYACIYATASNAYTSLISSAARITTANSATTASDMPYVGVSIFR